MIIDAVIARARSKCVKRLGTFPKVLFEAYARAVLSAESKTEHTAEKALLAVYPAARSWAQGTRQWMCVLLDQHPDVVAVYAAAKDDEFAKKLITSNERRAILAALVRTPLTDVANMDEGSVEADLSDDEKLTLKKVKVTTFTREDGATETRREVETYDRIAAARLDAELAGDLRHDGGVNVQITNTPIAMILAQIDGTKTEPFPTAPK